MSVLTLSEARESLGEQLEDGTECPCCGQFAKVYKRPLHAAMARDLILFNRACEASDADYLSVPRVLGHDGGDFAKLVYWGLIEKPPEVRRADGSTRVGLWRVTPLGLAFIRCWVPVMSHARIYNGTCLALAGNPVSIVDCLGHKFDYNELMSA